MLAYRHEQYVAQAIEGVVKQQTSFPFELVIGEDCSPDNTLDVALAYQNRFPELVRVISSNANVGARKNSYRLEVSARGKYIAYCEGDDYWHDFNKLQMQVDFLENNPDYGLVFTNADYFDVATGKLVKSAVPFKVELWQDDNAYFSQLRGASTILPLTVCVRGFLSQQILNECPEVTDPSYTMGDTQRFLEIAYRTKIKYIPVASATHNLLQESASRSQNILKKAEFVKSSQRLILHYLDKYPLPKNQDAEVRRWVALRALHFAYLCHDKSKAIEEKKVLNLLGAEMSWKSRLYYWGSLRVSTRLMVGFIFQILNFTFAIRRATFKMIPYLKFEKSNLRSK
jgi:glycosyltransferase involved in cell wall biosynthesis